MNGMFKVNGMYRDLFKNSVLGIISLILGLSAGCFLAWIAGEEPLRVVEIIIEGGFGTAYDIGMVIYFATILMATGLAVSIPFQCGNFNIGAEGQTLMAAFAAGAVGAYAPRDLHPVAAISCSFAAAILLAGIWGSIAASIRVYRGGHEVISSIMLNFVAAGLTSWLVVDFLQAPDSQNPEMLSVADNFQLKKFSIFDGAPATPAFFLSVVAVALFWIVLHKLSSGYRMKTVKQSVEAALLAGYSPRRTMFWAFTLGSSACGIAGAVMVLGEAWRFRLEMSDGFGFLGIPVALLGRSRPLGVVASAFLFAFLHHGSSLLDIESAKISRDLAQVIEAAVVLSVIVCPPLFEVISSSVRRWRLH